MRSANANANKIDSFLTRTIDYQAAYDPANGNVDATATITLHNAAPAGGLPEYLIGNSKDPSNGGTVPVGTNTMYLSYYSPLTWSVGHARRGPGRGRVPDRAGRQRLLDHIRMPGPAARSPWCCTWRAAIPAGSTYRLQVLNQPLVHDDTLSVAWSARARRPGTCTRPTGSDRRRQATTEPAL